MAPNAVIVEWQTGEIIKCLLMDDDEVQSRKGQLLDAGLECDGPTDSQDDSFDPVLIADKLRSVADALNDNANFRAALSDLKKAAAQEAAEAAFSSGVETLCQAHVSRGADVAPEMQLIRASVAFGLYVKKCSPELKNKVHRAMTAFLTRRVGTWVTQQGGWDKVNVKET